MEKDSLFYARSGGGLTLSGGEPLMQYDFVYELLTAAKARHIHRAMESSGFAETEKFLNIASLLNYLHMDIKHLDSKQHELFTGQPNERILHNIGEVRRSLLCMRRKLVHLNTNFWRIIKWENQNIISWDLNIQWVIKNLMKINSIICKMLQKNISQDKIL